MLNNTTDFNLIEYILSVLNEMEESHSDTSVSDIDNPIDNSSLLSEAVSRQTAREVLKFMDKIPGGFLIYHADGNEEIIYANQALLRLYKCATLKEFRELTGNSFKGVVYPDDYQLVSQSIKDQLSKSKYNQDYVEYRIIQKDGEVRWVEDYGNYIHSDMAGNIFYVFIVDATEKKLHQIAEKTALLQEKSQKEKYLKNQIEQYNQELKIIHHEHLRRLEIIEGLSTNYESIFHVDLDANTIHPYRLSDRVERQYGTKFQDYEFLWFISDYIKNWVCSEDQDIMRKSTDSQYIRNTLANTDAYYVNFRVTKDGETQYLQLRIVDVGNKDHISQVVMGCRRVDEEIRHEMEQKKIVEDALNHARLANITKNTFLSNMSHDMRTPLNAITGFTALAKAHINEPKKILDYLGRIETASEQLLGLINNILEISRIESGKIQLEETPCSLLDIIKDVQKIVLAQAEIKNIAFSINLSGLQHTNVYCDHEKLNRILLCLTGNAIKYTENGGRIYMTVTEHKEAAYNYAVYQFMVEDNGIGISENYIKRIFDPFERVENTTLSGIHGTGLGLTIVKSLVDLMSGTIEVSSSPGKGSKFIISIKLRLQSRLSLPDINAEEVLSQLLGRKKILLVDDNEINREIEAELLENMGLHVDTAKDGSIAVRKIAGSAPSEYALILMDIQMPVMNGHQAARAIRELENPALSSIPIIALSANAYEEDQRMSMESGMNAHMAKPVDIPKLLKLITAILSP